MPDTEGSLMRHAAAAACLTLFVAAGAAAQIAQPTEAPAPSDPQVFPRYEFHLTANTLIYNAPTGDERFSWETHFGGSMDLADYVAGRTSLTIDYEAVLGSEYRPFDPNQGNYTLEAASSVRIPNAFELVGVFHHVSRHLSDRPKPQSVAWNLVGARALKRFTFGETTFDIDVDGAIVVQKSFVDYDKIGELQLQAIRRVTPRTAFYGRATGEAILVDGTVPDRGTQTSGRVEVGFRLEGERGAIELFAGAERRADAYPLDRVPQQWGLAGFRLVSR
jgi:hypothetical protein